jgi:hypothetical protein
LGKALFPPPSSLNKTFRRSSHYTYQPVLEAGIGLGFPKNVDDPGHLQYSVPAGHPDSSDDKSPPFQHEAFHAAIHKNGALAACAAHSTGGKQTPLPKKPPDSSTGGVPREVARRQALRKAEA